MRRPFGVSFHGTKSNNYLPFHYIALGPSSIGAKYVLLLRDDHSSYSWFFAFPGTVAEYAATAIIDWCTAFGTPNTLVSDGPTHFKNKTARLVAKNLKVFYHFTLPCCAWPSGAVERLEQKQLHIMRAIVAELQLCFEEWQDILPIVQSAINNAPSPREGSIAPIMALNGIELTPPIKIFYSSSTSRLVLISDLAAEHAVNLKALIERIAEPHPLIREKLTD